MASPLAAGSSVASQVRGTAPFSSWRGEKEGEGREGEGATMVPPSGASARHLTPGRKGGKGRRERGMWVFFLPR